MEENFAPQQPPIQQPLPNSTAVLVLGILSIAPFCCTGVIGLTLSIIALVLASKAEKEYRTHPGVYTVSSYKNMNAGKICAIIGTCMSAIYLGYIIFYLFIIGTALSALPLFEMFS
ncbi:MAG: hypothetical protein LBU62_09290 [Bacteroidales bacterium]|jgi:hypothetical protein|nr:hypothetical protein [Bacteroidales bacterium]